MKILLSFIFLFSLTSKANLVDHQKLLLNKLESGINLNIKKACARALNDYIENEETTRRLIDVLSNPLTHNKIKGEVAKTLSQVADREDVYQVMANVHDRTTSYDLKITIMKSLYKAAPQDPYIRRGLLNNLRYAKSFDLQKAAAFGLMELVRRDQSLKEELKRMVQSFRLAPQVRAEILKTLFNIFNLPEIYRLSSQILNDQGAPKILRKTALKILKFSQNRDQTGRALVQIIENSFSDALAFSAIMNLSLEIKPKDFKQLRPLYHPLTGELRNPFKFDDVL